MIAAFAQPTSAQISQLPQPVKTKGYIDVAPRLVGVGQNATVTLWNFPPPLTIQGTASFEGFKGVTVTFTRPDGTKDTFMPKSLTTFDYAPGQTESLGGIVFNYKPNMAGNWSVSFTLPAQNITSSAGTVQYQTCTSNTASFTVQTEPVLAGLLNGYPWSPLPNPNTYWDYPISSNNREWYQISGDWLQGMKGAWAFWPTVWGATVRQYQPYGSGPNTAHVLWKQPWRAGGLIGGDYGSLSYNYPWEHLGVVIMDGKVFAYLDEPSLNTGNRKNQFICIDMATGELLYTADGIIKNGVHLPGNASVQQTTERYNVVLESSFGSSPQPYLFGINGTTWNYYDPFDGAVKYSIVNCTAALTRGYQLIDGTNLVYVVIGTNLTAWDKGKVVNNNWPTGITWTRKLPTAILGTPSIVGYSNDLSVVVLSANSEYWGINTTNGDQKWYVNTPPLAAQEPITLYGADSFVVWDKDNARFNCYSALTGALRWTSDSFSDSPWASWWTRYNTVTNDNDNMYTCFPDGTISALSLADGHEVWRSEPIASTEYTNNVVPFHMDIVRVGGNVYVYGGLAQEYQINPIPRQAMCVCINATTGGISWTLNGGVVPVAAANGYIIATGTYDQNYYCIGKGPTKTTVTAPLTTVAAGTSMLIQGSVVDTSAAAQEHRSQVMFPNGVPAIADENMSEFMDYLYMQNATLLNNPPICTGVPVTLTAVDPNGNTVTIGTTTSDDKGNYGLQWTPTSPGVYHIYAAFAGSDSYFTSSASTYATVASTSATAAPTSSTLTINSNTDTYLAIGVIAIIIAIAIVGALILRKK
jgi:hypothetical protein